MNLMSLKFRTTIELVVCHIFFVALGTKKAFGYSIVFRDGL